MENGRMIGARLRVFAYADVMISPSGRYSLLRLQLQLATVLRVAYTRSRRRQRTWHPHCPPFFSRSPHYPPCPQLTHGSLMLHHNSVLTSQYL